MLGMMTRMALCRSHLRSAVLAGSLAVAWAGMAAARTLSEGPQLSKPDTAEAHLGRGYEALKDERYREATDEFQAALALNPSLTPARYQLAVCRFALGDFRRAREEFERLDQETGGSPNIAYYLARLDLSEGNPEAAIKRLVRLVKDPPFADTPYYLGKAYLERQQLDQAEKWLLAAAQANPRDYRVADHLARVYQREGRKADAEKQFEISSRLRQYYDQSAQEAVACSRMLETQPLDVARPACQRLFDLRDPDRLTTLGLLYGQHGFYAEAVPPLEMASRLDPDSFEIQHDLGLTYFRLRRYAEACAALAKAVVLRPEFFGSNALLGAALYALGRDDAAYTALSHAHALNPQDRDTAELLFKESMILADREENHKNYSSALTYLQSAVQLRPEDQEIRKRLSALSRRMGEAR